MSKETRLFLCHCLPVTHPVSISPRPNSEPEMTDTSFMKSMASLVLIQLLSTPELHNIFSGYIYSSTPLGCNEQLSSYKFEGKGSSICLERLLIINQPDNLTGCLGKKNNNFPSLPHHCGSCCQCAYFSEVPVPLSIHRDK